MLALIKTMTAWEVLIALVDVALVSYLVYRFLMLLRGTRATAIISGLVLIVAATSVSRWLRLDSLHWLLRYAQIGLLVALPIVFQPELRRALEQVGRGRIFTRTFARLQEQDVTRIIEAIVGAVRVLARNHTGAIIVLERETGLSDVAETGIPLDSAVTQELLVNLFVPRTPLHDGATIIRGDRIVAAGCFLPLTDQDLGPSVGSRHRAAVGIGENSDAVAVVVSEETGSVSVSYGGRLIQKVNPDKLHAMLEELLVPAGEGAQVSFPFWNRNSE